MYYSNNNNNINHVYSLIFGCFTECAPPHPNGFLWGDCTLLYAAP